MRNFLKFAKQHWIVSIIAFLFTITVIYQVVKPEPKPEIVSEIVQTQTLLQTVDASGEIASMDKVELSFGASGRVSGIFVREGDIVEAGQILATIDTKNLFADHTRSTGLIIDAQTKLGVSNSLIEPTAILVANTSVSVAEVSYKNAMTDLNNVKSLHDAYVSEAQASLYKAEHDLEQLQLIQNESEAQIREDFVGILQGNVISARSALTTADEILGITNTLANDDFDDFLSLTDSQILRDAESHYNEALKYLSWAETKVFSLTTNSTYSEIENASSVITSLLSETSLTLLYTRRALDATPIDSQTFSFDDLSAKKAGVNTARDLIRSEQDALETQFQLKTATELSNMQNVLAKQDMLENAKQTLNRIEAQRNSSMSSAESTLSSTRAGLEQKIASAYETIGSTYETLNNSEIRSTISGVITEVESEIGEYVAVGQVIIKMESANNNFEVKVNVPESDIAKIKIDQPADVEFDAYGSSLSVPAQVSFVNPAEKVIEGVVFYEVTLFFTTPENLPLIKPGMTADVSILTNEIRDALSVPQRAVSSNKDGNTYVRVKSDDVISDRQITTGLRVDGGRIEITDGLADGDEVVISIR
jgi:RND family efflux transporter MFP subunit